METCSKVALVDVDEDGDMAVEEDVEGDEEGEVDVGGDLGDVCGSLKRTVDLSVVGSQPA